MSRAPIFLTGGTGFLGSHIAEALVAGGHSVAATVRLTSDTKWIDGLDVERVSLDLSDHVPAAADGAAANGGASPLGGDAGEALAKCAAVVHCGALTKARDEAEFMAVNMAATERLARAAARSGVERFVFISSLAARGPDGLGRPSSPYGRSKAAAEAALAALGGPMEVVILRPGGIYGPRDSALLPLFRLAARGWVASPRTTNPLQPVFVTDVASAVLAALASAAPPREPLSIAGETTHAWDEVASALGNAAGRPTRAVRIPSALVLAAGALFQAGARTIRRRPALDRRVAQDMTMNSWTCDIGPTLRLLRPWQPMVSLDEGVARTHRWYREHGWL